MLSVLGILFWSSGAILVVENLRTNHIKRSVAQHSFCGSARDLIEPLAFPREPHWVMPCAPLGCAGHTFCRALQSATAALPWAYIPATTSKV